MSDIRKDARVKIINRRLLTLAAQKLLRRTKDKTGIVIDRYMHPRDHVEVVRVQLEPSGWIITMWPGAYEEGNP